MEIVLRIAVIYIFLMVALRTMGKREFGQLTPFELVTLLLIPEIVTESLVGEDHSLTAAIAGVSTLLVLVFLTSALSYRFPRIGRLTEGKPAILAHRGELVPETMHRERISPEEIEIELHKYGLEALSQVKWAILETDGSISIVPRGSDAGVRLRNEKELP